MVTIVVLINILISLMLLYLAQQLRKVKNTLALITGIFNQYECAFHYRTKSNDRKEDLDIYKLLLDMYYPY